uniref:Immunoglobulin subtype domain-containing protein n=1 Tax=Sus scrofa TaxID=9823 RepID=A0A4X1VLV8_PIG
MAPHPTTLLCFGESWNGGGRVPRKGAVGVFLTRTCLAALCLGQTIRTCRGALPRPSITAEPGPVVPWGQPVTIVCQGPAGAETFHLQYKENTHKYKDESNTIQIGPHQTAARFPIAAVSEDTARCNRCFYYQHGIWSEPSEALELVLTDEDVSALPSGWPQAAVPSCVLCPWARKPPGPRFPPTHTPLPSYLAQSLDPGPIQAPRSPGHSAPASQWTPSRTPGLWGVGFQRRGRMEPFQGTLCLFLQ